MVLFKQLQASCQPIYPPLQSSLPPPSPISQSTSSTHPQEHQSQAGLTWAVTAPTHTLSQLSVWQSLILMFSRLLHLCMPLVAQVIVTITKGSFMYHVFIIFGVLVYLWLYNPSSWVSSFGIRLVMLLYPAEDRKSTLSLISQSPCILCDQGPLYRLYFHSFVLCRSVHDHLISIFTFRFPVVIWLKITQKNLKALETWWPKSIFMETYLENLCRNPKNLQKPQWPRNQACHTPNLDYNETNYKCICELWPIMLSGSAEVNSLLLAWIKVANASPQKAVGIPDS